MKNIPEEIEEITIEQAQRNQPWTVPYSEEFLMCAGREARQYNGGRMQHLYATHTVLHAMKSLGKMAAIFEAIDHRGGGILDEERATVRAMAADLLTAALRFGNLYGFSIVWELARRVRDKNSVDLLKVIQEKAKLG